MTATVTRGGPAAGNTAAGNTAAGPGMPARAAVRRRRLGYPRTSTTPGKVRLIGAGLVLACLAWGALAALMVDQHASAASEATATSEPLSLAAQQMYQSLADADVTASTGYLYGRTPPFSYRQRYQRDIAAATADLKAVTAVSGGMVSPDFQAARGRLSTLLASAGSPSAGSPSAGGQSVAGAVRPVTAAHQDANSWFAVNQQAQKLDKALDDGAAAGSGAFTGLAAGVAVLALAMAAGCAGGLSRRLAEYR